MASPIPILPSGARLPERAFFSVVAELRGFQDYPQHLAQLPGGQELTGMSTDEIKDALSHMGADGEQFLAMAGKGHSQSDWVALAHCVITRILAILAQDEQDDTGRAGGSSAATSASVQRS